MSRTLGLPFGFRICMRWEWCRQNVRCFAACFFSSSSFFPLLLLDWSNRHNSPHSMASTRTMRFFRPFPRHEIWALILRYQALASCIAHSRLLLKKIHRFQTSRLASQHQHWQLWCRLFRTQPSCFCYFNTCAPRSFSDHHAAVSV